MTESRMPQVGGWQYCAVRSRSRRDEGKIGEAEDEMTWSVPRSRGIY